MNIYWRAVLCGSVMLSLLSLNVSADAMDDQMAKARGVPVAQVQAEYALVEQKAKNADLEKQVKALKDQLAKLKLSDGVSASAPAVTQPARTLPK